MDPSNKVHSPDSSPINQSISGAENAQKTSWGVKPSDRGISLIGQNRISRTSNNENLAADHNIVSNKSYEKTTLKSVIIMGAVRNENLKTLVKLADENGISQDEVLSIVHTAQEHEDSDGFNKALQQGIKDIKLQISNKQNKEPEKSETSPTRTAAPKEEKSDVRKSSTAKSQVGQIISQDKKALKEGVEEAAEKKRVFEEKLEKEVKLDSEKAAAELKKNTNT